MRVFLKNARAAAMSQAGQNEPGAGVGRVEQKLLSLSPIQGIVAGVGSLER